MPSVFIGDFHELFNKIKKDEERQEGLNKIKNALALNSREAARSIKEFGLSKIINCFSYENDEQDTMVCDILKSCFQNYPPGEVLFSHMPHIMYMLRHFLPSVRLVAVEEVAKAVMSDETILPTENFKDMFVAVAHLVADADISISSKAVQVTSNLPTEIYSQILEEMIICTEVDASARCNVFEVIVNISIKSEELLKLSVEHGYLQYMMKELKSHDVLYVMNILELLSTLTVAPYGIKYLVECGALTQISKFIADIEPDSVLHLLIPGYMKFFGCIAHMYPKEVFDNYPVLLESLFKVLQTKDESVLPIALETLGFIGTTVEGKLCLAALGSEYITAVETVGNLIKTGTTDIKIKALNCLTSLIACDKDPCVITNGIVDHRVTLMTREWFRSLNTHPPSMEILQDICKNPFTDIRMAAFALLDAACQHHWAEELVAQSPGFIEYLLDRTVDYTKESKEAKYQVIKKLSKSCAFDPNIIMRLKNYVEEGPFFTEANLEVMMEEE